jgi:hypothetical protein
LEDKVQPAPLTTEALMFTLNLLIVELGNLEKHTVCFYGYLIFSIIACIDNLGVDLMDILLYTL